MVRWFVQLGWLRWFRAWVTVPKDFMWSSFRCMGPQAIQCQNSKNCPDSKFMSKKKLYNIERRTFSTSFSESDLGTCNFRLLGLGYFVLSQQKSKAISKSPRYWQVFAVQLLITSSAPWLIPILFKFYIMAFYKTIKKPIRRELFMKSAL